MDRLLENCTIGIFADNNAKIFQDINQDTYERYLRSIVRLSHALLAQGASIAFINKWATSPVMDVVLCDAVRYKKSMGDETVLHYTLPEFKYDTDPKVEDYRIMKTIVSYEPEKEFLNYVDSVIFLAGYETYLKNMKKPTYVAQFLQNYLPVRRNLQKLSGLSIDDWQSMTNVWADVDLFSIIAARGIFNSKPKSTYDKN